MDSHVLLLFKCFFSTHTHSYCTHAFVSFLNNQTEPPVKDGDIAALPDDLVQEKDGEDYAERISLIKHINVPETHEKVVQSPQACICVVSNSIHHSSTEIYLISISHKCVLSLY